MEAITRLIKTLRDFQDNINSYLEAATMGEETTIVDMNISQLYDMGENRNGEKIRPPYAPETVAIKRRKGQPTNRVTLRDTFAFQSSFYINYLPDGFEIAASDPKTERLKTKYGNEILGLQDEAVKYLSENVYLPYLRKELEISLGYE